MGKDAGDAVVNIATLGLLGVNENGDIGAGLVTRGARDGLKEVTGARAAEDQVEEQKRAAKEAAAERRAAIVEEQRQRDIDDIAASNRAQALRTGVAVGGATNNNVEQSLSRDFLGM